MWRFSWRRRCQRSNWQHRRHGRNRSHRSNWRHRHGRHWAHRHNRYDRCNRPHRSPVERLRSLLQSNERRHHRGGGERPADHRRIGEYVGCLHAELQRGHGAPGRHVPRLLSADLRLGHRFLRAPPELDPPGTTSVISGYVVDFSLRGSTLVSLVANDVLSIRNLDTGVGSTDTLEGIVNGQTPANVVLVIERVGN
jgi:hypothetical protein